VLWLVAVHALAALLAAPLVHRAGRAAFPVLALAPAAALGWALAHTGAVLDGRPVEQSVEWIPAYGVSLAFRLDALSLLLVYLASGVGALVLVYCARYFDAGEPGLGLFAGALTGFAGAMFGLVTSDDVIVLYIFWELTTILSFLLIGHYAQRSAARRAAVEALVVTSFGGLAMLGGLVLLGHEAGTFRLSVILAHPPRGAQADAAVLLVLVGALAKSAILPFSSWLPGAMAAPTPVSAYLHAAAMVKAGVYLVARLAPACGGQPGWRVGTVGLGAATMLFGGARALREYDLKRVLAFGTVSQLGFLVAVFGLAQRAAAFAGVALLLAHALFKAALFLAVGVVDRCAGTRDLRKLSGLRRALPGVCLLTVGAAASMAAVPVWLGFAAKEALFEGVWDLARAGDAVDAAALAVFAAGSALTVAYSVRVVWGAFGAKPGVPDTPVSRPAPLLTAPPALLSLAGLALGAGAPVLDPLAAGYADTLPAGADGRPHLAALPAPGPALWFSFGVWAAGLAVAAAPAAAARAARRLPLPAGTEAVGNVLRAVERAALQITGSLQRGSLPVYVGAVFAAAAVLGGWALAAGAPWPSAPAAWDGPGEAAAALAAGAAGIAVPFARARLAGAALAGACGLALSVVFLAHGAPDVAFTQVGAETVSLVVFVLAARGIGPALIPAVRRTRRAAHLALAAATGAVAAALTWVAAAGRVRPAVSGAFTAAARRAGLDNVVSAILLEYRGWDTLGESCVLAVAAGGVTGLVFLRRDTAGPDGADRPGDRWLSAAPAADAGERSLMLEVVTRLTYHTILLVSVYLLVHGASGLGGGFVAGLLAGLALALRYLAGGRYELAAAAPVDAGLLLGTGLLLSAGTAAVGYALGADPLAPGTWRATVPGLGAVQLPSTLLFDTGVYVLVTGVVLDVLRSLGAEADRQGGADPAPAGAP
jgi:multicomponent Na+:H+ antiporter subunit A